MLRRLVPLLVLLAFAGCGQPKATIAPPCVPSVPARMGQCVQQHFGFKRATSSSGAQGLDISNYQSYPDLARAKRAGLKFLIGQSNDGSNFTDFNFVTNWQRAKALGIAHGAYLFARPSCASCQAALMAAQIRRAGGMDANALPPTIDAEVPGAYCEVPAIASALRADLHIHTVLTYTSPGLWGCGSANGGTLLWVAVWGSPGYSFAGWHGFVAQQFCGTGCYFPGVGGQVDRDVDHGLLALVHPVETHSEVVKRWHRELNAHYRLRALLHTLIEKHKCRHHAQPRSYHSVCGRWLKHGQTEVDVINAFHRRGIF